MKKIVILGMTFLFCLVFSLVAYAGQWDGQWGVWVSVCGPTCASTYTYQFQDGTSPRNCWVWTKGGDANGWTCSCFNDKGVVYKNCTTPDGYTVDKGGDWIVNGVKQVKLYSEYPERPEFTPIAGTEGPYVCTFNNDDIPDECYTETGETKSETNQSQSNSATTSNTGATQQVTVNGLAEYAASLNSTGGRQKVYASGNMLCIDSYTSDPTYNSYYAETSQYTLDRLSSTWNLQALKLRQRFGTPVVIRMRYIAQDGSVLASKEYY